MEKHVITHPFTAHVQVTDITDEILELLKPSNWEHPKHNEEPSNPENLRKELFREESDKRVERFFVQQSGWVWVVYRITDIPEAQDDYTRRFTLPSKDGMSTYITTSLFKTEEKAWEHIETVIRESTSFNDGTLTHVIELDKM